MNNEEQYMDEINSTHDYYIKQLQKQDDYMGQMDEIIKELQNQLQQKDRAIDECIELVESYNLGKYDYSIPPSGIIELLKKLQQAKGGCDEI